MARTAQIRLQRPDCPAEGDALAEFNATALRIATNMRFEE
jgi:hypothetical protein